MSNNDPRPLNSRQERFCRAYLAFPNATHAAKSAGYNPRSAAMQGSRLLTRPDVRARLRAMQSDVAERTCARTDALLAKLESVFQRALEFHQFHAAGKAVEAQARLSACRPACEPADGAGGVPD